MEEVMGVINLSNDRDQLNELTFHRSSASVPFGGRYRLIDFTLSNMVNSGIRDVSVFISNKYRSLMDHLGTGAEWDLDRKRGGLFILPPSFEHTSSPFKGDLQHFQDHIDFFYRGQQKYVILTGGNLVANMDFRPAFEYHQVSGADITVIYKKLDPDLDDDQSYRKMEIDEHRRIITIENESNRLKSNKSSLEIYIIEKQLLLDMIHTNTENGKYDFLQHCIIDNLHQLKIFGFEHKGYAVKIDSIESYYRHNLKLLSESHWHNLFSEPGPIYTKTKDEPPAKYLDGAEVSNSIVANGCLIEGKVENSILFRGVKVHKGAIIKNSIIMQKSEIGENTIIENVILDKEVFISPERKLIGTKDKPLVLGKKSMI
ncbi:glucose-1-phosphate adenylyltransferase subunit GlgD [Tepidibacillus fermentans]|uniref:Glucose-1-phosphate adenylyltransferase n=1 Tax=Tepidibacillus fermentans TaxID=1281767 RepID=A0A4R3KDP7_9BACI|nr:glucose-1-phosphate adenylyltransferase subunit GlgD [Tepidibacillus fermentans]TCS81079.1 glucose-1-phosphate adenylyltransferase [Tepidibacillus fermentans]